MNDIVYVNEHDDVIGQGSISHAIENGIIKRVSQVFLFNSKGDVFIQHRSNTAPVFPNRWNASTAGHVDVGETYLEAIQREMKEEVGIEHVSLTEVGKAYMEELEGEKQWGNFCTVYIGRYDGPVIPDEYEVSEVMWITPEALERWMTEQPSDFTPTSIQGFRMIQENGKLGE